jgi:hypothetical protein
MIVDINSRMAVCRASSTLLAYDELRKHCDACCGQLIPGILNKRDFRLSRDEVTEKDIAQIHGLDIVERKVCRDCSNKIAVKSQLKIHCGHKVVDGYCKRYLFDGQRRSHYVFTEDQPPDDEPDVETPEELADWAVQNGERIFELSSIVKESQTGPAEAENDVYVDKRQISHNINKLIDEHTDFEKDVPLMIDFTKNDENEEAMRRILTIYFQTRWHQSLFAYSKNFDTNNV